MKDEVSISQLIFYISNVLKSLKLKWFWIILITICCSLLGYLYCKLSATLYEVDSSFGVEGQKGSGAQSAALNIAAQLGFPLGSGGAFPDNKMCIGIITSRRSIKSTLLEKYEIDGQYNSLANHYIRLYLVDKGSDFKKMEIKASKINQLSISEDSLLESIYYNISKKCISASIDEEVSLVRLKVNTNSYFFSKYVSISLVQFLNKFFLANQNQEEAMNYSVAQKKCDSINTLLKHKELELAKLNDSKGMSIKSIGMLAQKDLQRDVFVLSKMYAEAVSALEFTKYAMVSEKSFLIVIDEPNYCVKIIKKEINLYVIFFGFIGFFMSIILFLGIDYLKKIKREIIIFNS